MENLEQTIQAVLNDPEQMKQVMEMAKAFGLSPSETESSAIFTTPGSIVK